MQVHGLDAAALLDVWERAQQARPHARALAMLAAATGDATRDLAALSVGARDAHLLDMRDRTFGTHVAGLASCPSCSEQIEFECDSRHLRTGAPLPPVSEQLTIGSLAVELRAPDSRDLDAIATAPDAAVARRLLLERCAVARQAGQPIAIERIDAHAIQTIEDRLAAMNAPADVQIALACPACTTAVEVPFDIGSFLWTEISAAASRLLQEVDVLARAYGWTEPEILALSPLRRQAYLEMAGA